MTIRGEKKKKQTKKSMDRRYIKFDLKCQQKKAMTETNTDSIGGNVSGNSLPEKEE